MNFIQDILVILIAAYMAWDNGTGNQITGNWPVTIGLLVGLVMGDVTTGLVIGGTLQLISLGVAGIGGSSVPEYGVATIVSIFLAVRTGADTGTAIAVGLPVGMLTLQLDVVLKMINNVYAHWSLKLLQNKQFNKMDGVFYLTVFTWMMKYVIPVTLVVLFGTPIVDLVLQVIPVWFTNGLQIAGGMLPVVGIGLLLRYMPVKKYMSFLIIGYVVSAYLNVPVLGIALLGAAAAYIIYSNNVQKSEELFVETEGNASEGDDFDE